MDINGFSKELKTLFHNTDELFEEIEIKVFDKLTDEFHDEDVGVMGYQEIKNDRVLIGIQEKSVNEYVISHELLHAYFLGLGYPDHRIYGEMQTIDKNLYFIQQSLYNTVIHKLIIDEQITRSISIEEEVNQQVKNIINMEIPVKSENYNTNPNVIARLFDNLVLYDLRHSEIEGILEEYYPDEFKYAKRLSLICLEKEYNTPFSTRRILVKVLKEFDSILNELRYPPLNLNSNVVIGFIPGRGQLKRSIKNTFNIEEKTVGSNNVKLFFLISKVDNQLSYVVSQHVQELNKLNDMYLYEFYKMFDIKYEVR